MPRLRFEKVGDSVWISHLDLMRVFQRAFRRAELLLKHSQGFNPRAIVSIALPLSVGVDSTCELLDFELEGETALPPDLRDRLNAKLPAGIRVLEVYEDGRKLKELTHLRVRLTLEYDQGVPSNAAKEIESLFQGDGLIMEKHSKCGVTETDILPMIRSLAVSPQDENTLILDTVICAQNPTLNPQMLLTAISRFRPQVQPDFAKCTRLEVLDAEGEAFR